MVHPRKHASTTVEKMLKRDFADAYKVDLDEIDKRGWPMRFLTEAARLFSPIL